MTEQDHKDFRVMITVTGLIVALGLFVACSRVADSAEALPNGVTCEQVRETVAEYRVPNDVTGRARIAAVAVSLGFTPAQVEIVLRCLQRVSK